MVLYAVTALTGVSAPSRNHQPEQLFRGGGCVIRYRATGTAGVLRRRKLCNLLLLEAIYSSGQVWRSSVTLVAGLRTRTVRNRCDWLSG